MKKLLFLLAFAVVLTACKKENEPNPQLPQNNASYSDFVVMADYQMDSVVFVNTTDGITEHIIPSVSSITCNSTTLQLSEFNLSHSPETGDVITITLYHNSWTFGNLPITDFLANSNTDRCEEFGGNSGRQTNTGNSTTYTFTAN